jgi:hypothetical protein
MSDRRPAMRQESLIIQPILLFDTHLEPTEEEITPIIVNF